MQEAAAGWQETSEPGAIREMPLEELHSGLQALSALSGTASRAPREPHFLLRAAPYTLAEGIGLHPSASGDGGRRWGQAGEGRYFSPVPPLLSSRLAAPEFLCQEAHAPGRKAPSPGVSSGEGTALSSSWRPLFPGRSLEKRIVLAVGFLLLSPRVHGKPRRKVPGGPLVCLCSHCGAGWPACRGRSSEKWGAVGLREDTCWLVTPGPETPEEEGLPHGSQLK